MAWCFEDEEAEHSKKILHLFKKMSALVPGIWPLEVTNVLCVAERKKRIDSDQSDEFLRLLNSLPIEVDSGLNRMFNNPLLQLARDHGLSAYDAAYLEIAQRYDAPLASFDKDLTVVAKKLSIKLL